MQPPSFLLSLSSHKDGIYGSASSSVAQSAELSLREKVASRTYSNYLKEISKHHSIHVMDNEVNLFLNAIPKSGVILDVGGCWGWHWRNLSRLRPDLTVVILDFCRANLHHSKLLLSDQIGKNIWLVHGDATCLDFDSCTFDGYWSAQTIQHIPDFDQCIREAHRVLVEGGVFVNYSLNYSWFMALFYRLFNRSYTSNSSLIHSYYLSRADSGQRSRVSQFFNSHVKQRYSEILYNVLLILRLPLFYSNLIANIDAFISSGFPFLSIIARQRSFHVLKHSTFRHRQG